MKKRDAVLLLSGGLDSCVAGQWALTYRRRLHLLHVDYGQRSAPHDRAAAQAVADYWGLPLTVATCGLAGIATGALVGGDLPDGADAAVVVPGRNTVLLALAASLAAKVGAAEILFAPHAGDEELFPDCRRAFVRGFDALLAASLGADGPRVVAPLLTKSKAEVAQMGADLKAPLHLTRSCYAETTEPCERCLACQERTKAMRQVRVRA